MVEVHRCKVLTACDGVQGAPCTRGSTSNYQDIKLLGVTERRQLRRPSRKLVRVRDLQLRLRRNVGLDEWQLQSLLLQSLTFIVVSS